MKKTHLIRRMICLILPLIMLLGIVPVQSYAATTYYINGKAVNVNDFKSSPGECWAYALKIYQKIWGESFSNQFDNKNNLLRNLRDGDLTLTAEHLKKYVSAAELGAVIRISSKQFLHANDGNKGHSQIIVQKDENGFTVIQGGLSASPYKNEKYFTWKEYINTSYLGGRYPYIKYIQWPGAPVYTDVPLKISMDEVKIPDVIFAGTDFAADGTITSNKEISTVHIGVKKEGGAYVKEITASPYKKEYSILALSDKLDIQGLSAGSYQYIVKATSNGINKTLFQKTFKVEAGKQLIADGEYHIATSLNNNLALDVEGHGTKDGDNIQLFANGKDHLQNFRVKHTGNGFYSIENVNSKKVLTLEKNSMTGTVNVIQKTDEGKDAQRFAIRSAGDGTYVIESKFNGLRLEVTGNAGKDRANIQVGSANKNVGQKWIFVQWKEGMKGEEQTSLRLYGSDRFETAYKIAENYKKQLGVKKFDNVIIASGSKFPDALSGSYLAAVKNAPILLADSKNSSKLISYIKDHMSEEGTVYILGGTAAVPQSVADKLAEYTVDRVKGVDRFETNLEILKKADAGHTTLLVSSANGFADSLSASATQKPILLAGDALTEQQKEYLSGCSFEKIYILGGESAVSKTVEDELSQYCDVSRIGGKTRYETSVKIAETFFENPETAVLTYALNYPDGLCGGILAQSLHAPLILTNTGNETAAASYMKTAGIPKGYILGGSSLISYDAVRIIFRDAANGPVIVK